MKADAIVIGGGIPGIAGESGCGKSTTCLSNAKPIEQRVFDTLEPVGLDPAEYGERYPHELSGGERQRVGIASAPVLEPELVIAEISGEVSQPIDPPPGCRFAARCPHAMDICRIETPALTEPRHGHAVACHLFMD